MGKGKGKGKGAKGKGKGKGKDGNGKGDGKGNGKNNLDGPETRICHWCKKPGHLKAACRAWLANKPKTPGVSSLEEEDWEEDLGTVDIDALCEGGACCSGSDLDPLDEDVDSGSESGDGWTDSLEGIAATSPIASISTSFTFEEYVYYQPYFVDPFEEYLHHLPFNIH